MSRFHAKGKARSAWLLTFRSVDASCRTPDGRRFLMIKNADAPATLPTPDRIVLVQNWFEEWKATRPRNQPPDGSGHRTSRHTHLLLYRR
jgi:hypothetical protein